MNWQNIGDGYKSIFNTIPNPAVVLDLDGRIEAINDACFEYFQNHLPPALIYGEKIALEKVFPWLKNELNYFLSVNSHQFSVEKEVDTFRGKVFFQIILKKILDPFDQHINTLILMNDITSIKEAEKKVSRARDFYLTLFEEFPAMIWRADQAGRFNYFNRAWLAFTGRSLEEEKDLGWLAGVPQADQERFLKVYGAALAERRTFEIEFRLKRHDQQWRWILCVGRPFSGLEDEFAGFIGSCYDITERKMQEEKLAELAMHDPLTGLPNRRLLEVILPRLIEETELGKTSALFFIDLDNFKEVNDNFGHQVGDELLIELGRWLKKQLREGDLLVRLGGDEFAILLDGLSLKEAENIARRLLEYTANHEFNIRANVFKVNFSMGIALITDKTTAEQIIARADQAMYQAKIQGGNRYLISPLS
ncbi:MAG: diguanylate cyclase [Candidatus Aminicenantes bacterium]|nr:diguanylate cyclase [Candidatus Aminicenantes bacterium]